MIPIRFGEPSRQLFGLYQPPAGGTEQAQCVVLCNPFGQEAIRCHRLLRVLADRLARGGFPVLRFDYSGSGDSDGDDAAADLPRWIDDVLRADEEARRASGHRSSSWFGLRLGASLAALASARASSPPRQLVLWDAIVDGAAYLEELAGAHRAALRLSEPRSAQQGDDAAGRNEALGFPLPAALRAQLGELTAASFAGTRAGRVSVVSSADVSGGEGLVAALSGNGAAVTESRIDSRIVWASDEAMNSAIVPADALQAITSALSRPA